MIKITLETSSLDLNCQELKELETIRNNGKIELYVQYSSLIEKLDWDSKKIGDILKWIARNTIVDIYSYRKNLNEMKNVTVNQFFNNLKDYVRINKQVMKIHSDYLKDLRHFRKLNLDNEINLRSDFDILAQHIHNKRDYFVTMDKTGFIKYGKKEKFENEFDIKIRLLNKDFINELKKNL